jgi:peroxiredoxin
MKRLLIISITFALLFCGSIGWAVPGDEAAKGVDVIFEKGKKLYDEGKYEEALAIVEEGLKKYPESRKDLLEGKYYVLQALKRYKDLLPVSIERDKLSGEKSPDSALEIADAYLYLSKSEEALNWLEKAAERGLIYYSVFDQRDIYKAIEGKRLDAIKDKIKSNLGIGEPVKAFNLSDLAGNTVSPEKFKGKVLLIDFWATWCPPCRKEIPNLKKDFAELNPKGFEILGISLDTDRKKLDDYIKDNNLKWTMTYSGKGWKDDTVDKFGVHSIPSTWLVDKKGNLRHFGLRGEHLRTAVEELLSE